MPNYNGLVNAMKQAGVQATKADGPVQICYGKVTSKSPLKILVDQKMTLDAAQLVLTRNVTDYEVNVTVDWETEEALSTHNHTVGNETSSDTDLAHVHALNGKKKMTIHNSLIKGDEVVLLRQQGGQKYIVIDRMV